jgi:hypothetical protein
MFLGEYYLARCSSGYVAYMTLQRALLNRWVARGGTEEDWCARLAPAFRARYGVLVER